MTQHFEDEQYVSSDPGELGVGGEKGVNIPEEQHVEAGTTEEVADRLGDERQALERVWQDARLGVR